MLPEWRLVANEEYCGRIGEVGLVLDLPQSWQDIEFSGKLKDPEEFLTVRQVRQHITKLLSGKSTGLSA